MLNVKYDFSSVHVNIPESLSKDIISWGRKKIKDEDAYITQKDPTFGREDEIHITVLYGIHNKECNEIIDYTKNYGQLSVKLGKINVFTNPYKFDVVMIEVISPDLCKLNEILSSKIKHTNKYGAYKPHITIAYVKKGKGNKHIGLSKWEKTEFICGDAIFSSKDGSRHSFLL